MARQLDEHKLEARQRYAYIALFVVGALTLVIGLVAELGHISGLLQAFGSGWAVAVEGAILLVLGYFTMRGSLIALGIAAALYAIDVIASLALGAISGIFLRLVVLFFLVRGFLAMRELRRRHSSPTPVAAGSSSPPAAS